jgi:hypothetical protein
LALSRNNKAIALGVHRTGEQVLDQLYFLNVDVPDPTSESADGGAIYWSLILANAGNPNDSTLVNAITSAADAVAGALIGTGNTYAIVVGGTIAGTDLLVRLLTGGCDGIVAAQNWAFTAAELANMASGGSVWNSVQNYPGTGSPVQCGAASNYDVNYVITSHAPVNAPNLVGRSYQDASSIAGKAGCWMEVIREQVSGRVDGPTVDYQYPGPDFLFPDSRIQNRIQVALAVPEGSSGSGSGGNHHLPR